MRSQPLKYFPVDWARFRKSKRVQALKPPEARGLFLELLCAMFDNDGWLPADDAILAGILGLSVRRWKNQYRDQIVALFGQQPDAFLSQILTNDTVDEVRGETLQRVAERQRQTAEARAKLAEKRAKGKTVTEPSPKTVTEPVTEKPRSSVTETVTAPVTAADTAGKGKEEKNKALLPNSRELYSSAEPGFRKVDDGDPDYVPLFDQTIDRVLATPNGLAEGSAGTGSPGLGGRSPPQPSETLKPTPALLATPLVKKARTGLMAALDSEEDID